MVLGMRSARSGWIMFLSRELDHDGYGRMEQHRSAGLLLDLEGVEVVAVDVEPDRGRTVWMRTSAQVETLCPGCGTPGWSVKGWTVTCPRDLGSEATLTRYRWLKRRFRCLQAGCGRKSFTESSPRVPARARLAVRLRERIGAEVAEQGRTVCSVAATRRVSWPVAHQAFADHVDPLLAGPLRRVRVVGIDEHRRGRARWRKDPATGKNVLVSDRWHTCFYDLSGTQGLLGQVEGRTSADAAYWLALAPAAWRQTVDAVVIDMCTIYLSAIRRALPQAVVAVDPFHVVQLANNKVHEVRRRVTRERHGRRGRKNDPEYGVKNLLVRNREDLTDRQLARMWNALDGDGTHGTRQILAAWIAKEKLRDVLALSASRTGTTPTARQVHERLYDFWTWCSTCEDIPEILSLATTIGTWAHGIVTAIVLGVSNARSEGLNRVAKLEARKAYGLRNPANQRRRVRWAATRSDRRPHTVTRKRSPKVIEQNHQPA